MFKMILKLLKLSEENSFKRDIGLLSDRKKGREKTPNYKN